MSEHKRRLDLMKAGVLFALAVVIVLPLVIMVIASLKSDRLKIMQDFGSLRAFWVAHPTLQNYKDILGPGSVQNFGHYFINSLIIMVCVVCGTIIVASMAGYALLRGKLKIMKSLLLLVIALYIIPTETIVLPLMYQVTKMGLLDTFAVQILPFCASPFAIFLFFQFMKEIPSSIGEAASIEGAGFFKVFSHIYFPLNGPAVVTVAILLGMESWNQFLWPLLVTQTDRVRPISIAIAAYSQVGTIYWNYLMAASALTMFPVMVFFIAFQKYFVASVASSAVKG